MAGAFLPVRALYLRQTLCDFGEPENPNQYEVSVTIPFRKVLVMSRKTGKIFAIDPLDLVNDAIAAGIDREDDMEGPQIRKEGGVPP